MKTDNILARMRQSISGYNKYIEEDYLKEQSPITLLRLCHPLDRYDYTLQLIKSQIITRQEASEFL